MIPLQCVSCGCLLLIEPDGDGLPNCGGPSCRPRVKQRIEPPQPKPRDCPTCGAHFPSGKAMTRHRKEAHGYAWVPEREKPE